MTKDLDLVDEMMQNDGTDLDTSDGDYGAGDNNSGDDGGWDGVADAGDVQEAQSPQRTAREQTQERRQQPQHGQQPQQRQNVNQAQQQQQDNAPVQMRRDGTAYNARGDIIDPKTGNIIATGGRERRLYEKAERASVQIQELENKLHEYARNSANAKILNDLPARLGLSDNDLQQGFELMAMYKQDPLAAARKIVALTLGTGRYNVSDIVGSEVGNAIDFHGIGAMMDQRLAPLQQMQREREQQQRQQQHLENGRTQLQRFFDTHEHSEVHADLLDQLIGERPELSPEQAYYEVKMLAVQYGLDFSRPLKPQIEALQQQTGNQQQQFRQAPVQRRANPPVSSPQHRMAEQSYRAMEDSPAANANDDWSSIIRQSFAEVNANLR